MWTNQEPHTLLMGVKTSTNVWKLSGTIYFLCLDIILCPNIYTPTNTLTRNLYRYPQKTGFSQHYPLLIIAQTQETHFPLTGEAINEWFHIYTVESSNSKAKMPTISWNNTDKFWKVIWPEKEVIITHFMQNESIYTKYKTGESDLIFQMLDSYEQFPNIPILQI